MKNNILAILMLYLTFYSCQKNNTTNTQTIAEDNGCIELKKVLVTEHSGHTINKSNIQIINGLFLSNGIDNSRYRYHYFYEDSTQTYYPPYLKTDTKSVLVTEFTNGLEIFTGYISFIFINDILGYRDGNETKGTTLDTIPHLNCKTN